MSEVESLEVEVEVTGPGRPYTTLDSGVPATSGSAYEPRCDDNDFIQPGTLVREVLDDAARERLVHNIVVHIKAGVVEPVLSRAIEYWRSVDPELGARVAKGLNGG
jgi:catalase